MDFAGGAALQAVRRCRRLASTPGAARLVFIILFLLSRTSYREARAPKNSLLKKGYLGSPWLEKVLRETFLSIFYPSSKGSILRTLLT